MEKRYLNTFLKPLSVLTGIAAIVLSGSHLMAQTYDDCIDDREDDKLIALYTFQEGSGSTVYDVSGFDSPHNLTIQNPGNVSWLPGGGLRINAATIIKGAVGGKIRKGPRDSRGPFLS